MENSANAKAEMLASCDPDIVPPLLLTRARDVGSVCAAVLQRQGCFGLD